MNEFKGTPGPWGTMPIRTVFPRKTSELRIGNVLDDGTVSAHVVLDGYHYGQEPGKPLSAYGVEVMTADANLIASATRMLAALECASALLATPLGYDTLKRHGLTANESPYDFCNRLRAEAIAAATGATP